MPTLRRRHSDPRSAGPRAPALVAGQRRLGGRGPRRLGRRRRLPRPRRGRQVAVRADRLGGRALARLADPGRDRALEPAGARRRPRRRSSLLAAAGVAAGIVVSNPSGGSGRASTRPRPGRPPAPPPDSATRTTKRPPATGPVLHGTAPDFVAGGGRRRPQGRSRHRTAGRPRRRRTGAAPAPTPQRAPSSPQAPPASPDVAGPAAIKVARKFAEAFVLYEIGHDTAGVKAVFAETASPDLTKALLGGRRACPPT